MAKLWSFYKNKSDYTFTKKIINFVEEMVIMHFQNLYWDSYYSKSVGNQF